MKGGTSTDFFIQELMKDTGKSISDADRNKIQRIVGMSDGSPSMRIRDQLVRSLQETGKSISDSDMRRIGAMLGRQKPKGMDEGGKVKKPKTLPKPKPKIGDRNEMGPIYTDTKTGKKVKRLNKGGGLNAAINRVKKAQGMEKGGAAFPDLTGDGKVTQKDILKGRGVKGFKEGGSTISDADSKKIKKILPKLFVPGESGKNISDADLKKLRKNLPFVRGKSGKDISNADLEKLMKPTNFKDGGAVRGMGRAYMGASRKAKIR